VTVNAGVALELIPLRSENHFKPRSQNRILVHLTVFFEISDEHPKPFYMGVAQGFEDFDAMPTDAFEPNSQTS